MTEPLMTIGAYARAVGVPTSALRHYDEVGLLSPDHVDPHTGYRYYSTATVRRAGRIRDLREAGIPIETMRRVLESSHGEAAAELRSLATDQEHAGARTAALLRQLAIELDHQPTSECLTADGAVLADTIRAAALHTGPEPPFDRVVLAAEPTGLDVIATNTFTLFAQRCIAPSTVSGRAALPAEAVGGVCAWLETQPTVTITLTAEGIRPADTDCPFDGRLIDAAGFPDHLAFLPPATTGDHRALMDRDACLRALAGAREQAWLAFTGEHVELAGVEVGHQVCAPPDGRRIVFSTDLLIRALVSLPGPRVAIDHRHPLRPCLLTSPVQPSRTAVVMPARPAG